MSAKIPNIQQMLSTLIAEPSVSCTQAKYDQSNQGVIHHLAQWLETLGFSIDIQAIPNHPGKSNLIATYGKGPGGLVLAGHTDTVPFDEDQWRYNPLALTEADGRFYGLGTCDMKGFFPLAIQAVLPLLDKSFKAPLIILATADEESSMSGARALVNAGKPQGRYAIIGEPTGLRPIRMHKGILMESIRITGQAGHSSNPALGKNALDAMHEVMSEIINWRNALKAQYNNPMFEVPHPTLNLGCMHAGDNPNRICSHAELQIDLRPLPGIELDELRGQLKTITQPIAQKREVSIDVNPLFPGVAPFETPAQTTLVKTAEKLTGHEAQAVAFATEAPFLTDLGMETLVLGPGDIDLAHQPDEYLALDRIQPMVDILSRFITRFCLT